MTFAKQDYDLPDGYDRMISDTNWDRTDHWRNLGPKSSQDWQFLQGGIISIGPRERYRIYNNKFRIFQALTTVYNFAFEYVSNYWVCAAGSDQGSKSAYTADTDTSIFPDDLMLAGLKFYFLKAKKLDYSIELGEFMRALSYCKAQDQPVSAMSLAPVGMNQLVGPWSVQDGNWHSVYGNDMILDGLYANIHAKRARIAAGSGEKMRKPGTEGAPSAKDFKQAAKTAKPEKKK